MNQERREAVRAEWVDMCGRSQRLMAFLVKGRPEHISVQAWSLLCIQWRAMEAYCETLSARLALAEQEAPR